MHFHSYSLRLDSANDFKLNLKERYSTNSSGISKLLGLKANANMELNVIVKLLESKITNDTLLTLPFLFHS
ncbi:hypothetical protein Barb7_01197 [Bacteroidales bacterium Barb7]|nr:hypothetical protein Barb7_01197 [Bacteroidales bacterium Barb7]